MDTVVTPYLKNLESIEKELPNIAKQAVINNAEFIINLLKHGQLEKGLNSFGEITGRYSFFTQGYANADNISTPKKFGDPYNFFWSGKTIEGLKIGRNTRKEFDITTVPSKQKLLEEIYGVLFDLTEEHNEFINMEIILPELEKYILDNLVSI